MFQHGDPTSTIGYVTLGLFSNAVLRELFAIVDECGELPKKEAIQAAIDSLRDLERPGSVSVASERLCFRGYEAAVTLFDVLESGETQYTQTAELVDLLEKVKAGPKEPRVENAESAISFFRQLSRRASVNSQVPQQLIPAGVRQLARQATA